MENEFDRILRKVRQESLDEGRNEGIDIGLKRGRNEGIKEVARSLIASSALPLSKVTECSGLTLQEVESIKNGIKA